MSSLSSSGVSGASETSDTSSSESASAGNNDGSTWSHSSISDQQNISVPPTNITKTHDQGLPSSLSGKNITQLPSQPISDDEPPPLQPISKNNTLTQPPMKTGTKSHEENDELSVTEEALEESVKDLEKSDVFHVLVISDLHLGQTIGSPENLCNFTDAEIFEYLNWAVNNYDQVILNGDTYDCWETDRSEFKVLLTGPIVLGLKGSTKLYKHIPLQRL